MIMTKQDLIDAIKFANTSRDGFAKFGDETIIPIYQYCRYKGCPRDWSNHQIALQRLKPWGFEQGYVSYNGGGADIIIHPDSKLSDELIDALMHLYESEQDGLLDDQHYEEDAVAHFESYAYQNYENIKAHYGSWEEAHYAMYSWGEEFGKDVDGTFCLYDEFSDTYAFEHYAGVLIKHRYKLKELNKISEIEFVQMMQEATEEYDFSDLLKFDVFDESIINLYKTLDYVNLVRNQEDVQLPLI